MKFFLYEFVTGGGMWSAGGQPADDALLAEGRCMIRAIAADFAALDGAQVVTTRDARMAPLHPPGCRAIEVDCSEAERQTIVEQSRQADWTLLIAPETGGALLERAQLVERAGGRLLSPPSAAIAIAADKQATAELLATAGVPVPRGMLLTQARSASEGLATQARSASEELATQARSASEELATQARSASEGFREGGWGCMDATPARSTPRWRVGLVSNPPPMAFPAVLKPLDGCGSIGVQRIDRPEDIPWHALQQPLRLEEFVPGLAASVAVLCGPAGYWSLPACQQRLTGDGRFGYLGGRLPLPPPLDKRARRLAEAAIRAVPEVSGYLGVDLVLGEAADGSGDRVIEINPRLTTSYVALRAASETNLAAAMLAIARGHHPDLRWRAEPIEFTAGGTLA